MSFWIGKAQSKWYPSNFTVNFELTNDLILFSLLIALNRFASYWEEKNTNFFCYYFFISWRERFKAHASTALLCNDMAGSFLRNCWLVFTAKSILFSCWLQSEYDWLINAHFMPMFYFYSFSLLGFSDILKWYRNGIWAWNALIG